MIRHAQASFGKADYDVLSDIGESQAKCLADHLIKQGQSFDGIYGGTLKRHKQTFAPLESACRAIKKDLPEYIADPAFNEYDAEKFIITLLPGLLEDSPDLKPHADQILVNSQSFQIIFEAIMKKWISGGSTAFDSDIQSFPAFQEQVDSGLDRIIAKHGPEKNIAIFTSGGPISAAVTRVLGLPGIQSLDIAWQVTNASITRIKYSRNKMALFTFNEFGFLEAGALKLPVTYR